MSRIAACMERLRAAKRSALIPYVVAGDPVNPNGALQLMHSLTQAGADLIELGFPFSDPMAEGPVIQRAHERSLQNGTTLEQVLETVAAFRTECSEVPVALMGYANPVEQYGRRKFAADAQAAGVDGLLLVDMPAESAHELSLLLREAELDMIFLAALTTSAERLQKIVELATGYLYYVSLKGVTGAASLHLQTLEQGLQKVRAITSLPVCAGFGVKSPETAADVARMADGVVVGSLLIEKLEACAEQGMEEDAAAAEAQALMRSFRDALDAREAGRAA